MSSQVPGDAGLPEDGPLAAVTSYQDHLVILFDTQTGKVLHTLKVSPEPYGIVANRELSIDVERGAITGLIGPNGSGKTTFQLDRRLSSH